jgi:hypothetical protein
MVRSAALLVRQSRGHFPPGLAVMRQSGRALLHPSRVQISRALCPRGVVRIFSLYRLASAPQATGIVARSWSSSQHLGAPTAHGSHGFESPEPHDLEKAALLVFLDRADVLCSPASRRSLMGALSSLRWLKFPVLGSQQRQRVKAALSKALDQSELDLLWPDIVALVDGPQSSLGKGVKPPTPVSARAAVVEADLAAIASFQFGPAARSRWRGSSLSRTEVLGALTSISGLGGEPCVPGLRPGRSIVRDSLGQLARCIPVRSWCEKLVQTSGHSSARIVGLAVAQTPAMRRLGGPVAALAALDTMSSRGAGVTPGSWAAPDSAEVDLEEASKGVNDAYSLEVSPGLWFLDARRWSLASRPMRTLRLSSSGFRAMVKDASPGGSPPTKLQVYVPTSEVLAVLLSRVMRFVSRAAPERVDPACLTPEGEYDLEAASERMRSAAEVLSTVLSFRRAPGLLCTALAQFSDPDPRVVLKLATTAGRHLDEADVPVALREPLSFSASDDTPERLGDLLRSFGSQAYAEHRHRWLEKLVNLVSMGPQGGIALFAVAGCIGDKEMARLALSVCERQTALCNLEAAQLGSGFAPPSDLFSDSDRALLNSVAPPTAEPGNLPPIVSSLAATAASVRARSTTVPSVLSTLLAGEAATEELVAPLVPVPGPGFLSRAHAALGPAFSTMLPSSFQPVLLAPHDPDRSFVVALSSDAQSPVIREQVLAEALAPTSMASARIARKRQLAEMQGVSTIWKASTPSPLLGYNSAKAQRARNKGKHVLMLERLFEREGAALGQFVSRLQSFVCQLEPEERLWFTLPTNSPLSPLVQAAVKSAPDVFGQVPLVNGAPSVPSPSPERTQQLRRIMTRSAGSERAIAAYPLVLEAAEALCLSDVLAYRAGTSPDTTVLSAVKEVIGMSRSSPSEEQYLSIAGGPDWEGFPSWDDLVEDAVKTLQSVGSSPDVTRPDRRLASLTQEGSELLDSARWAAEILQDEVMMGLAHRLEADEASDRVAASIAARVCIQLLPDFALAMLQRELGATVAGTDDRRAWLADSTLIALGPCALALEAIVREGLRVMTLEDLKREGGAIQAMVASELGFVSREDASGRLQSLSSSSSLEDMAPHFGGTMPMEHEILSGWHEANSDPALAPSESDGDEGVARDWGEMGGEPLLRPEQAQSPWAATVSNAATATADGCAPVTGGAWEEDPSLAALNPLERSSASKTLRRLVPRLRVRPIRGVARAFHWEEPREQLPPLKMPDGTSWSPEAQARTVFVAGLPLGTTVEDVAHALSRCGAVSAVRILDSRAALLPYALRQWRRNVSRSLRNKNKRGPLSSKAQQPHDSSVGLNDLEQDDDEVVVEEEDVATSGDEEEPTIEGASHSVSVSRLSRVAGHLPESQAGPAWRTALTMSHLDHLIDLASIRPGVFHSGEHEPSSGVKTVPRAVKRRSAEMLEAAMARFPVHALVTFETPEAASVATCEAMRLFGVQIGPRSCVVSPSTDATVLHVSGVPLDMTPGATAAAVSAVLHRFGMHASLRDRKRLHPHSLSAGEVVLRLPSFRDALLVEHALKGAFLAQDVPLVAGFGTMSEWWKATKGLMKRVRRPRDADLSESDARA